MRQQLWIEKLITGGINVLYDDLSGIINFIENLKMVEINFYSIKIQLSTPTNCKMWKYFIDENVFDL